MVDMQYDIDGLTRGAAGHRSASDAAELVGSSLAQLPGPTGGFGTVPSAAAFAAALNEARLMASRIASREVEDRRAMSDRVSRTVALGGGLVAVTSSAAIDPAVMLGRLLTAGEPPPAGSGDVPGVVVGPGAPSNSGVPETLGPLLSTGTPPAWPIDVPGLVTGPDASTAGGAPTPAPLSISEQMGGPVDRPRVTGPGFTPGSILEGMR